eukprot:313404-Prorocentrum_minimum.AAC.1
MGIKSGIRASSYRGRSQSREVTRHLAEAGATRARWKGIRLGRPQRLLEKASRRSGRTSQQDPRANRTRERGISLAPEPITRRNGASKWVYTSDARRSCTKSVNRVDLATEDAPLAGRGFAQSAEATWATSASHRPSGDSDADTPVPPLPPLGGAVLGRARPPPFGSPAEGPRGGRSDSRYKSMTCLCAVSQSVSQNRLQIFVGRTIEFSSGGVAY